MRTLRPDFYERFHCIGGKCTDTCCAGWEIEVDPQTAEAYRQMNTPLGREIAGSCEEDSEGIWFRMTEDGRCPFLNAQGLCRIILQCGEGALCDICREHPRFYNWCADRTEVGLGLSCEEAVRLLFDRTEPIRFLEEDDGEIEVDMKYVRVDTYHSSGAGGQNVNKTSSAVRMTYVKDDVTIVVACQTERD